MIHELSAAHRYVEVNVVSLKRNNFQQEKKNYLHYRVDTY